MKVKIVHDNVIGTIVPEVPLPPDIIKYIDDKTKYRLPGYERKWSYIHGTWDGYTHAFDIFNLRFRRGLLNRIVTALKFHKYEVEVVDQAMSTIDASRMMLRDNVIKPYDFQARVRDVVRANERGIIASPTGTGKTVMTALIIDELRHRTLVVVNELVLLDQMHRSLSRTLEGAEVGYIGNTEFSLGDVVVATVQSLTSILGVQEKKKKTAPSKNLKPLEDWLSTVGLVIHDEAHLADADTAIQLYSRMSNPRNIYGFSATPYGWADKQQKAANIELEQVFGNIIYSTFDQDFIGMGLKVPCIVKSVEVPYRLEKYGTWKDNQSALYKKALQFEILENDGWANAVKAEVDEFNQDGSSCFVYASHSLEYGHKIAKILNAPFVNGKTPREERFRIFDALQNKEILTIVSDIGGIGLDIPSLDAFILASDVKDIRQMRGRVERADPKSGKKFGYFVDLWKRTSFLSGHRDLRVNQYTHDKNIIL